MRLTNEFEMIEDWAGKLHGQVMRIAGLFHIVEHIDDRIYDVGDRIDDIKGDLRTGNAYIKGEVTTHRGY